MILLVCSSASKTLDLRNRNCTFGHIFFDRIYMCVLGNNNNNNKQVKLPNLEKISKMGSTNTRSLPLQKKICEYIYMYTYNIVTQRNHRLFNLHSDSFFFFFCASHAIIGSLSERLTTRRERKRCHEQNLILHYYERL